MQRIRASLPAAKCIDDIISAIQSHPVTIIRGATGSGKSTQGPQYILESMIRNGKGSDANIICTQPRRVAAIGVAERVAAERNETVGDVVGYAVRGDTKVHQSRTKLLFCTTGVLLRRLHDDPELNGVSHVIVDEVHERSVDSDFLLILLRDIVRRRKSNSGIKVILMSATLDADQFANYFKIEGLGKPRVLEIPGFTYPVRVLHIEDILRQFTDNRQILSNTAGATITNNDSRLLDDADDDIDYDTDEADADADSDSTQAGLKLWILPLHAGLTPREQALVFKRPQSGRKVVLATNIAETSITIDDIEHVIDFGRVKESQYNPRTRISCLVETFASRAACRQRQGRAGRSRPGTCYKLFTRKLEQELMEAHQLPEIQRVPLTQLCLDLLSIGHSNIVEFLAQAIDPPPQKSVFAAISTLNDMGALIPNKSNAQWTLTPLGSAMARIPADVRIAKMLVLAATMGCFEQVLSLTAVLSGP
ncbi:P-loop containing nucleoside triphosphate hydrolase protein, partial [Ramicandelaber brevisporus]